MQSVFIPNAFILTLFTDAIYPYALIIGRPQGKSSCTPVTGVYPMARICHMERQILISSSDFTAGDYDLFIYGQRSNINTDPANADLITKLPVKFKTISCV